MTDLAVESLPNTIVYKSHEELVTMKRKKYNMAYHSNGYNERQHDPPERGGNENNKPTYLMEHLATFTVTSETGIVYPADGMRRLLQLEKTNGIWSQKMQLCLDHPWVLIMDYETGTVMERFPASSIQEPTAFTSHDPMEIYNNILVFIVGSTGMGHNPYPEMHIFQCQSISALDLVEDLKQLRSGKSVTGHKSSTNIPPPMPAQVPLNPVIPSTSLHRDRDRDRERDMYRDSELEVSGINDETSSTTSEKYERDVTVLNHCFDDIEKFIARLQHAAAASRELERRRRNRKSKKKDIGDGMLTMRTKPPPEKEFIDIFQKFKLSFNLLAKLKAHIHDPNAPELIHFLFTPLALIVDASHETFYDPHLPAKVVAPLLTREAINLLMNCVTSKETELWHSLGNAWLIPRDQWKGHVPPYHPVFMDGWSPDYTVMDEAETSIELKGSRDSHEDAHYNSNDYFDYEQPTPDLNRLIFEKRGGEGPPHREEREPKMSLLPGPPPGRDPHPRDLAARSDISVDSIERSGHDQEAWLNELQARGANIVQVTYPRTANNDKELTVVRGEYLEVLDDARKWWKARNWRGQVAHVPHTIVAPYHYGNSGANDSNDIFNNPLYTQNYNRNQGDAASETFSGAQSPSLQEPSPSADWVIKERLDKNPPPMPVPPPMPQPSTMSTFKPSNPPSQTSTLKSIKKDEANSHNILDELSKMQWPSLKTNRPPPIIKPTPKVYISDKSSVDEVQKWMRAKTFSENLCKHFEEFNGEQLMSINFTDENVKTFESRFGPEIKRLVSQIKLQKEICGFTVGRNSEFKRVLERAKERASADKTIEEEKKNSD